MTPVYGLWETVDVQSGHRPPHVKQPNIANLVYICTIKVHGREKRYDCYRNTKIVGKMNQKRPDIERYRHLDACTQSERGEAGGREQMSVRDGAASQLPRT